MGITLIYSTTYFGIKFLENYFHCFVLYFPWLCARWQVASGHSYCLDKLSTKEIWGNVFLRIIWNVFLWIIWKVFLGIIKIFLRNICKVFFTYECSNSFQVNFFESKSCLSFPLFPKNTARSVARIQYLLLPRIALYSDDENLEKILWPSC